MKCNVLKNLLLEKTVACTEKLLCLLHVIIPAFETLRESEAFRLRCDFVFDRLAIVVPYRLQVGDAKRGVQQFHVTLEKALAEILVFEKMHEHPAVAKLIQGISEGVVIGLGKTTVTIIEKPSVFAARFALPLQHVVLRPIEVGSIDLEKHVVDIAGYVDA